MGKKLKNRYIGDTEIALSEIGLGTVKLGRDTDVKYPHPFKIPDDNAVLELLSVAYSLGVNYLDTAVAYGIALKRLGQLLPRLDFKFKIVVKIGERYSVETGSKYDFSINALTADLKSVRVNLDREFLEIVLLHCGNIDTGQRVVDGIAMLKAEKKEGRIGAVGVSCKTLEGVKLSLAEGVDVIMIEPVLYAITREILHSNDAKVGVLVKKVFSSGTILSAGVAAGEILSDQLNDEAISSIVIGTINTTHLRANVKNLVYSDLLNYSEIPDKRV
jgi:aryl-alcohol dehydrogenase-like predicted oxidoreductase